MSCCHDVAVCDNRLSMSISFAVTDLSALTETKESEKNVAFVVNGGNRNALLILDNPVTMREYKTVYEPKYQSGITKRSDNCSEMSACAPEKREIAIQCGPVLSIEAAGPTPAEDGSLRKNVPQFWKL